MQTRIYVPLTVAALRDLSRTGAIGPAPLTAFAVTTDLRQAHTTADEEQLEYLAFLDAARSFANGVVPVIAAADVDEESVAEVGSGAAEVRVSTPVPRRRVAAFQVAEEADMPTGSLEAAVDYLWYDATELDVVIDLLT